MKGPKLPKNIKGASSVEINGNLYLIGGIESNQKGTTYSSCIYKISCYNNICNWEEMDQKLDFGRHDFIAMAVSDTICIN